RFAHRRVWRGAGVVAVAFSSVLRPAVVRPRAREVDSVAEAELKAKYKVKDHCTFLVFKDGNETGAYTGPYGKADIVDYMHSLMLPPGVGTVCTWPACRTDRCEHLLGGRSMSSLPSICSIT
ncbi:unnamed protein product, partial [Prorocentrum cordatum]